MKLIFYKTRIGEIGIAEDHGSITNLYFESGIVTQNVEICETENMKQASRQLHRYWRAI